MEGSFFLPLPEGLSITQICQEESTLVLEIVSELFCSCCPLCTHPSDSIHSYYCRTIRDVPCGGQAVRLHLTGRKFFCHNPECKRKIFTERLPTFVEPWAQMTLRLAAVLQAIGLSTSGSLGARLANRLSVKASWMTILRRIMELSIPVAMPSRFLALTIFHSNEGVDSGPFL